MKRRKERRSEQAGAEVERGKGRAHTRNTSKASVTDMVKGNGKGAGSGEEEGQQLKDDAAAKVQPDLGPLVVLACRHIYHQSCLENMQADDVVRTDGREYRCPIDG